MDAIFGPRADIIWHGKTEYGSHILSGRTKYTQRNHYIETVTSHHVTLPVTRM